MNTWDYSEFWNEVIKQLEKSLDAAEFKMWFNIQYQSAKENTIIVSVASSFYKDQVIGKGYKDLIEKKLFELSGQNIHLEIEVKPRKIADQTKSETVSSKTESELEKKTKIENTAGKKNPSSEYKHENNSIKQQKKREQHPSLKAEYTFDNFVIGDNNSFAANAAMAVASNPGKSYNPLLLYGGPGLGKTHLMESIGNYAWENNGHKVIYVTAEDFVSEFMEKTHNNTMSEFKNKYRKTDLLLIDDIQFFARKMQGSQSELFYTFNALENAGKQIVFTCDRPVSELSELEVRIKSRCEKGLNVDLQPPDFETRWAILKKKMENQPKFVEISDDVLFFIAENISTNIRDLEGCLTKVIAYANFKNITITKEIAEYLLKDNFNPQIKKNITVETIQKKVAEYFNISLIDMKGKKRPQSILLPRYIAMYLCRKLTEMSLTEIGMEFGGRDHATIINSLQKLEGRIKAEPTIEKSMNEITKMLKETT